MKRTWFWRILATWLALAVPAAAEQDEQQLRYLAGPAASAMIADAASQPLTLTTEPPLDVKVPEFKATEPLFAQWATPMTSAGYIWLALDRSVIGQPYDTLYIDSNLDGSLKDETPIVGKASGKFATRFGPVTVVFPRKDGKVRYELELKFSSNGQQQTACVISACCYQGQVTLGGEKLECVLVDYNANGTFDDKSPDPAQADRLRLKKVGQGEWNVQPVSDAVAFGEKTWRLDIAASGARISFADAAGMKFGKLRIPEGITKMTIIGPRGRFTFEGSQTAGRLPVGNYRVIDWLVEQKDNVGRTWRIQAYVRGDKGAFDIAENGERTLEVGLPITSKIEVQKFSGGYRLNHNFVGRLDEQFYITCDGRRAPPPKVHVWNAKKTYNRLLPLAYG